MTTAILDGNYDLYRSLIMGKEMRTAAGESTGGIFIFLKMLRKYKNNYDNVIVVFDGGRPQFRMSIFPEYKKKPPKEDTPEERERQETFNFTRKTLCELLPKMGIPVVVIPGEEGDDVICKLGEHFVSRGENVTLISDDSDYYLFLEKGMTIYRSMKDEIVDKEKFIEKFNFPCNNYLLYLAMTGTHNGVPGIPGIGPKTASKIINYLNKPDIDSLIFWANANKTNLAKKVLENIHIVHRNLLLINTDALPLTKEAVLEAFLRAREIAKIDYKYVFEIFKRFEFKSLSPWLASLS